MTQSSKSKNGNIALAIIYWIGRNLKRKIDRRVLSRKCVERKQMDKVINGSSHGKGTSRFLMLDVPFHKVISILDESEIDLNRFPIYSKSRSSFKPNSRRAILASSIFCLEMPFSGDISICNVNFTPPSLINLVNTFE